MLTCTVPCVILSSDKKWMKPRHRIDICQKVINLKLNQDQMVNIYFVAAEGVVAYFMTVINWCLVGIYLTLPMTTLYFSLLLN